MNGLSLEHYSERNEYLFYSATKGIFISMGKMASVFKEVAFYRFSNEEFVKCETFKILVREFPEILEGANTGGSKCLGSPTFR